MRRLGSVLALSLTATALAVAPAPVQAQADPPPQKEWVVRGFDGAVTSVDEDASAVGLAVLRRGGNAVDAAVATAAALGVTEPFSAGIGGGGYFLYYDAASGEVHSIDGRETAPAAMPRDAFINPATGRPYNFSPQLVTSGVSVGVPGTLATWQRALRTWGTLDLAEAIAPSRRLASTGFRVDRTFRGQVEQNLQRFRAFTSTRQLYGRLPRVGSTFRNPDLAATYRLLMQRGPRAFYRGPLAGEMVRAVRRPPTTEKTKLPVPEGFLARRDLKRYRTIDRAPTHVEYRGLDVYGMAPSSSGGSTVGEALNILERHDLGALSMVDALHLYLEASALSFADRSAYVGDPKFVDVPLEELLSDEYAAERDAEIDPEQAMDKPVDAGVVAPDTENVETTNLTVADRWGNVVEYTLTIEQTGGSGIVVPGRGFLLNNELTDFSPEYDPADPNRIQPLKRPRSSMAPTIVLDDGEPFLAVGSPGGSTIITTVLQILLNRIDLGMTLPQAIAAPRATQRNEEVVLGEGRFVQRYSGPLEQLGHELATYEDIFTGTDEIGAATGIEFGPDGLLTAVAEPRRRGGGSAKIIVPDAR